MTVDAIKRRNRGPAQPYFCDADREYWQDRKNNYVPVKKVVVVRKPLYLNNVRFEPLPWAWQLDKRETTYDTSDWEMTCDMIAQTPATLKRLKGDHAID